MLFPRRTYRQAWSRLLHDRTADRIIEVVSQLPHVNATIVPFNVDASSETDAAMTLVDEPRTHRRRAPKRKSAQDDSGDMPIVPGTVDNCYQQWRQTARI